MLGPAHGDYTGQSFPDLNIGLNSTALGPGEDHTGGVLFYYFYFEVEVINGASERLKWTGNQDLKPKEDVWLKGQQDPQRQGPMPAAKVDGSGRSAKMGLWPS